MLMDWLNGKMSVGGYEAFAVFTGTGMIAPEAQGKARNHGG